MSAGNRSSLGDVDGPNSTPYKIDQAAPNLNRYSATRRVGRAIFLGSAPTHKEQNKGLDDKQINLGVVQPGERPAIFSDALRRLTNQAKFMHSDLGRYWYSTSGSLNRMAADRAGQLEEALVLVEIDKALATYINGLDRSRSFRHGAGRARQFVRRSGRGRAAFAPSFSASRILTMAAMCPRP